MTEQIEFIAYADSDQPFPQHVFLGSIAATPVAEVPLQPGTLLPIAESTTLPLDYYDRMGLDTRHPNDARRQSLLTSEDVQAAGANTFTTIASGASELLDLYEVGRQEPAIADAFNCSGPDAFTSLNRRVASVPSAYRHIAYRDPTTALALLNRIGRWNGIDSAVDHTALAEYVNESLGSLTGVARLEALAAISYTAETQLSQRLQTENEIIRYDTTQGSSLQIARIMSKRAVADAIDGALFHLGRNTATIVDPAYLLDETLYANLETEPPVSLEDTIDFMRHMMNGVFALGQDHTFLYRNILPNIAQSQTATVPDYSVLRPGNFVYHDLKLLEHGPYRHSFPTAEFFAYIRHHYLRQMGGQLLDANRQPAPNAMHAAISFRRDNQHFVVPLEHSNERIIPFRALRKDAYSSQYFEYDESCYLAELVDIALQLDLIEEKRGTYGPGIVIGDRAFGQHAAALLKDMFIYGGPTHDGAVATVIEQLLFMDGRSVKGGHGAIADTLRTARQYRTPLPRSLQAIEIVPEHGDRADRKGNRQPLTCYYEWFRRHARPVSDAELSRRGQQILPPAFT